MRLWRGGFMVANRRNFTNGWHLWFANDWVASWTINHVCVFLVLGLQVLDHVILVVVLPRSFVIVHLLPVLEGVARCLSPIWIGHVSFLLINLISHWLLLWWFNIPSHHLVCTFTLQERSEFALVTNLGPLKFKLAILFFHVHDQGLCLPFLSISLHYICGSFWLRPCSWHQGTSVRWISTLISGKRL